jgi:hypothetical protein
MEGRCTINSSSYETAIMVGRERPRSAARMPKTIGAAGGYCPTIETVFRCFDVFQNHTYGSESSNQV